MVKEPACRAAEDGCEAEKRTDEAKTLEMSVKSRQQNGRRPKGLRKKYSEATHGQPGTECKPASITGV